MQNAIIPSFQDKLMPANDIIKAAHLLRMGGLVAFPTETVYGLGADASNEAAARKIFAAKERPYDHPLIVHIAEIEQLSAWASDIPPTALQLAKAFWPGPLTLILKKQPHVLDIITGGQDTVGLRIPNHPIALSLLRAFGGGIAAPSANKFTHISPTTAEAVREELGNRVDLTLDGGNCTVGLESTILDLSKDKPVILRKGMVSAEAIQKVIGIPVTQTLQDTPLVRAPGMHHLHYAPVTTTVLLSSANIPDFIAALRPDDFPVAILTHSQMALSDIKKIHRVQASQDATTYAHDLYSTLRSLDNLHFQCIIIEDVPNGTEWEAIRDRLNKASGRRA